jgi:5'(3')-deoxyribonucleotidase
MDGVLVDFTSAIDLIDSDTYQKYESELDNVPGIFSKMKPDEDMVDLYNKLDSDDRFDCYVLSTAPWDNPTAWCDKLEWIKKYLPSAHKKLILSHNKNLNKGDYLIDDRTKNGAGEFDGVLLLYGTYGLETALSIENYICT